MEKRSIFAKISAQLEKHLGRMLNKLKTMEADLKKLDLDIEGSTGAKQMGLKARRVKVQEKYENGVKRYNLVYSMNAAVNFLETFFGSFKIRWIPIVITAVLVVGSFRSWTSFLVGTVVNVALLFGVLTFVMYGMYLRGSVPEFDSKKKEHILIAKGIFLALAVVKVLYTVLGPGLMIAAVLVGAVGIGLWIERDDLKVLFERWKAGKKSDDKDDDNRSGEGE